MVICALGFGEVLSLLYFGLIRVYKLTPLLLNRAHGWSSLKTMGQII